MSTSSAPTKYPRVTIEFCVQCKWNLRAAYFAQELLSTFSTDLGEVALQPTGGGVFIVTLYTAAPVESQDGGVNIQTHVLWNRKAEGGFPETKELKRRVRDIIDPSRNLGHVDGKKSIPSSTQPTENIPAASPTSQSALAPRSIPEPKTQPEPKSEAVNSRGKIVITGDAGESFGFCRPGEDCEDCA